MKRNGNKPLGCGICPYKTNSACHLERHLRIHTGHKPYACDMCSYRATDGGLLKRHMRIHSGEKPFICHICGHKTAQSCSLKDHMAVHTGKKRYSCDLCPFQCSRIGRLRDHQRGHKMKTERTQEGLPKDETPTSSNDPLEPKYDTDHVLHKCPRCNLEFSEVQYLYRHVASVHSEGSPKVQLTADAHGNKPHEIPHFCSFCATSHESSEALESHIALHVLYKCLKCNSVFETPDELTAHGFIHTSELIFNCNFCDFKCRTRNELRGHGRVHSTQQFKCSTCEFESKSAIEFSQHLMTHTMKEIVVCNICSQKFRKTEDLRDHMVSHYTRLRSRTIKRNNELKLDNSDELVGDSYSCFYCTFKCPEEREVEKHIIDVHVPATSATNRSSNRFDVESCGDTISNPERHDGRSLVGVSSCWPLDHQLVEPGLGKTVTHHMYRGSFSTNLNSRELRDAAEIKIPHLSRWNHHTYAGHFLDRHSFAYSMNRNGHEYFDSETISNCHPSLSMAQFNQTSNNLSMGGLTEMNHKLYLQTVRNEMRSSVGLDITKSGGISSSQDNCGTTAGLFLGGEASLEKTSVIYPTEENKVERYSTTEEGISDGNPSNSVCKIEVFKTEPKPKSLNEQLMLTGENSPVTQLSIGAGRKSSISSENSKNFEFLYVSNKSTGVSNLSRNGGLTNEMRGIKRKIEPIEDDPSSHERTGKTTVVDTVETSQPNTMESRQVETPGDILLSKLRKFFNESFTKFDKTSDCRSTPDYPDVASANITIDSSSDDGTTNSN